ncbi:MAG: hypothetical protein OHK0032_06660 [Thermodesulfovibrionales bacterium]
MPRKKKHLPVPPKTPFGRNRLYDESQKDVSLTADRMAEAMAEGRIEDFFQSELPQGEHAKKLASMMLTIMGMTLPAHTASANPASEGERHQEGVSDGIKTETIPEEVVDAAQSGDVRGLMEMLKKEHEKRMGHSHGKTLEEKPSEEFRHASESISIQEKDVLDKLIKIASKNRLDVNWLIFRAIKLYVEEYEKTGRL